MDDISSRPSNGFTLIEAIVATAIVVTVLAGSAQLYVLGSRVLAASGSHDLALTAAQAGLDDLRSRVLGYAASGEPLTDPALVPSPDGALAEDVPGYVDFLDATGRVVDEAGDVAFVRRWAITPVDRLAPELLVIEVCVFRWTTEGSGVGAADACLSTARARQP